MEALIATYGSDSAESPPPTTRDSRQISNTKEPDRLPPPPLNLLQSPKSLDFSTTTKGIRIRSFPHVEGNYALHVFTPVHIPSTTRKQLALFVKKIASVVPSLYAVDVDSALSELCKDDQKLEQILLGRKFHISLGRTIPIQAHQIDSIVAMLRQKFQSQISYWIEFNKWDVFVNDEQTRSFLSLEVAGGGLSENPRPHISLAWALGDISYTLKQAVEDLDKSRNSASSSQKHIFMCKFSGIKCKIGSFAIHPTFRCRILGK